MIYTGIFHEKINKNTCDTNKNLSRRADQHSMQTAMVRNTVAIYKAYLSIHQPVD